MLLCTELVTNVYEHAPGPFGVRLRHSRTLCRVSVEAWDTSPDPPKVDALAKGKFGGRGMVLPDEWAVDRVGNGKAVWAHVACGK